MWPDDEFCDEIISTRGIAPSTAKQLRFKMRRIREIHGPGEITTASILKTVKKISETEYAQNYKVDLISTLKALAMWLADEGQPGINIKKIKKIKPSRPWKTKKATDMLTHDEVIAAIGACRSSRDRAFVAMLYDGAHRPGELVALNWEDISFEHGIHYDIRFKTEKTRTIALTIAIPYLMQWREDYPGDPSKGPVFVLAGRTCKPLTKKGVEYIFSYLREATKNPKLKPGILRPTRITHDVQAGLDLGYIMLRSWGSLKTTMIDKYSNISSQFMVDYALEKAGIEKVERKKAPIITPVTCPACHTINPLGAKFCTHCMQPLTEEARRQYEIVQQIRADPDSLRRYADWLERGGKG